jgi:hypothetical protein
MSSDEKSKVKKNFKLRSFISPIPFGLLKGTWWETMDAVSSVESAMLCRSSQSIQHLVGSSNLPFFKSVLIICSDCTIGESNNNTFWRTISLYSHHPFTFSSIFFHILSFFCFNALLVNKKLIFS